MVVADNCPTAEVTICANGLPLHEYEDDESEAHPYAKSISRYVECASDQIFEIHVDLAPGTRCSRSHVQWRFFVDGKRVDGRGFCAEQVERHGAYHVSRGTPGEQGLERYCFSALDITDALQKSNDGSNDQLGTIMVKLYHEDKDMRRAEHARAPRADTFLGTTDQLTGDVHPNRIPEKDVKGRAISHGVSFVGAGGPKRHDSVIGPASRRQRRPSPDYGYQAPRMVPHSANRDHSKTFTWIFKYRTLRDLKSLLIVPRTPTPSPSPPPPPPPTPPPPPPPDLSALREPDDLSRDELINLVKQFQESQQATRESKRERSVSRVRDRKLPGSSGPEAPARHDWKAVIYRAEDGEEIEIIEID